MTFNRGSTKSVCLTKNWLIMTIIIEIYGPIKSQPLTTASDNEDFYVFSKSRHPDAVGGGVTSGIKRRREGDASAANSGVSHQCSCCLCFKSRREEKDHTF